MSEADQMALLLSLQREMAEMKRKNEKVMRKNEQEMQALRTENEEMKKKLVEEGPSVGPTNVFDRSYTSPPNPRPVEETRDKVPTYDDRHLGIVPLTPLHQRCHRSSTTKQVERLQQESV